MLKKMMFNSTKIWAVIISLLGLIIGILINTSRWSLAGKYNSRFSQIAVALGLAFIFYRCFLIWRNGTWKNFLKGRVSVLVFFGITFFNTFVVVYNKLIPEKLIYTDWLSSIFAVIFFFILVFLIELCFLDVLHSLTKLRFLHQQKERNRSEVIRFCLITFGILVVVWGLYLYAAYPGLMTLDSFSQWKQAGGQQGLSDWFPVFHTLVIRGCRMIWDNPASVIIFQILFMASVFTSGMLMFYKRGVPSIILYSFTLVFAFIPNNGILMVNMQKDIPFMISFMWLVFLLMKFILNNDQFLRSWFSLLCLFLALTLTALFRHNGTYITYGFTAALIILSMLRKKYRLLIPAALSIAAILIIRGPVYQALNVLPTPEAFVRISPVQDIAGVYNRGGNLSQETLSMMEQIMPFDYWVKRYNAYTADTYLYPRDLDPEHRDYIAKIEDLPLPHLLRLYVDTLLRSPVELIGSRVAMTSMIWNIDSPVRNFDHPRIWDPKTMQDWAQVLGITGINWHPNALTKIINDLSDTAGELNPILYIFLSWPGISNAVIMLLAYFWFINRKYDNALILVPFIISFFTLALSIPAQEFRYVWHHTIFTSVLFLFTIADHKKSDSDQFTQKIEAIRPINA